MGLPQAADEATRELPDPVEVEQIEQFDGRHASPATR
jgi:hypothetical protein